MTTRLEDRIALWLSAHPASTVDQIARGVHSRTIDVRDVLKGALFTYTNVGGSRLYRLGGKVRDGLGRASETDCEFLERVLADGEPHNLNEILRRSFAERGVGLTVHSRAAELRTKRGLDVRNWKDGERGAGSWYRLVLGEPVRDAAASPGSPSPGTVESRPPEAVSGSTVGDAEGDVPMASVSPTAGLNAEVVSPHGSPSQSSSAVEPDGQLVLATPEFRKAHAA